MNIFNFQSDVSPEIYERGLDYFLEYRVTDPKQQNETTYKLHVKGSSRYEVIVQIEENRNIIRSSCTCPYDYSPVCKHEVAAYLKLSEYLTNDPETSASTQQKSFASFLENLTKDELIEIILRMSDDDETLAERIKFSYTKDDELGERKQLEQVIHSIKEKYADKRGFISYTKAFPFSDELNEVLEKADEVANLDVKADIILTVLRTALETIAHTDDSSGTIGFVVKQAIEKLEEVSQNCQSEEEQKTLFYTLIAELDDGVYASWENYKISLFSIIANVAEEVSLRERLKERLRTMLEGLSEFEAERVHKIMYKIIAKYETPEKAEQYLYDYIDFRSCRELLIETLLRKKDYEKVIELAKVAERKDEQYLKLYTKWKTYRYEAVKALSKMEEQQALAKELFLEGDFSYYEELKKLTENKDALYNELVTTLKKSSNWKHQSLLLDLIETENDIAELLEFVQRHPTYIETYAEQLGEKYQEEVAEMYEVYIKEGAAESSNRTEYREVCKKIKHYTKFAGEEKKKRLIEEFKEVYKRKPAFVKELGKL